MTRTADAVVVGGGVVGAACAYFLSREGLRVHLVERQYFSAGASRASHGGLAFMHEGIKHRTMTVPGEFFDVNPNRQRTAKSSLSSMVRFSFGPPRANLEAGLDQLLVEAERLARTFGHGACAGVDHVPPF